MSIHFYCILPFTGIITVLVTIYFIGRTFTTFKDDLFFFNLLKFIYLFAHNSFKRED